ncbi:MAG: hypothetical protein Q7J29_14975 [Stagnimonas sp.]|nr:hypothetical protein [Stagnimonas sp.]
MANLTDKQLCAARVLAEGGLCKDAATAADVTPETISAWKKQTSFQHYANALRNEKHKAARDALRTQALVAIETLGALMASAKSQETRRKAAVDVLTLMGHGNIQTYYTETWSEGP